MDQSSYVGIFYFLDSPFEYQVGYIDEFDFSYEIFNSCDTEFVPADLLAIFSDLGQLRRLCPHKSLRAAPSVFGMENFHKLWSCYQLNFPLK